MPFTSLTRTFTFAAFLFFLQPSDVRAGFQPLPEGSLACQGLLFRATHSNSGLQRVKLSELTARIELMRPTDGRVFFDPPDSLTLAYTALDASTVDSYVLELGSGSGLPTRIIADGVKAIHGVDVQQTAVDYSNAHFAGAGTSFSLFDYLANGTSDLLMKAWPHIRHRPDVLISNPPYVPCTSRAVCDSLGSGAWSTMYGGPDGTRYLSEIIAYADSLQMNRLALVLGSYSRPLSVFKMLQERGYQVTAMTLTAVKFGEFSNANRERIFELESAGGAFLWRSAAKQTGYMMIGLATARNSALRTNQPQLTLEKFTRILTLSSLSQSTKLETLSPGNTFGFPIRVIESD
jgi:methylase of polypeptide subunit release factors